MINPSWHPQALVEVDLAKPLIEDIDISCGEYSFKQKVLYKHLPNACFLYGAKDHVIKNCPFKFPEALDQGKQASTRPTRPPQPFEDKTPTQTPIPKYAPKDRKDGFFVPTSRKQSFKQHRVGPTRPLANFYSLLDKPYTSDEEDEQSDTIMGTLN